MLPEQFLNSLAFEEEERGIEHKEYNMERVTMREDTDTFTLNDTAFKNIFRLI